MKNIKFSFEIIFKIIFILFFLWLLIDAIFNILYDSISNLVLYFSNITVTSLLKDISKILLFVGIIAGIIAGAVGLFYWSNKLIQRRGNLFKYKMAFWFWLLISLTLHIIVPDDVRFTLVINDVLIFLMVYFYKEMLKYSNNQEDK